jgi:hypothetical protein
MRGVRFFLLAPLAACGLEATYPESKIQCPSEDYIEIMTINVEGDVHYTCVPKPPPQETKQ